MKVGLQTYAFDWKGSPGNIGSGLVEYAHGVEEAGFDSLWVMDHFFQLEGMLGKIDDPMLEAYTTLGFLAAHTSRVQLGVLVTGVIYREPGLLLKAMTTLDVLSGGRSYFGVGAAWFEREARGLGFPFPAVAERFEWLEEVLKLTKQVWRDDRRVFEGKHFKLSEPIVRPQPLAKPHPPIMIGGGGEKKTLKLVAEYGDACNLIAEGASNQVGHKLEVLKNHCEEVGRDYGEIEKTVMIFVKEDDWVGTRKVCQGLAKLGIDHVMLVAPKFYEKKVLEVMASEVVPAVGEM